MRIYFQINHIIFPINICPIGISINVKIMMPLRSDIITYLLVIIGLFGLYEVNIPINN